MPWWAWWWPWWATPWWAWSLPWWARHKQMRGASLCVCVCLYYVCQIVCVCVRVRVCVCLYCASYPSLLLLLLAPPCNTIRLTILQHGETQNLRARSVGYLNEKQCYYHSSSKSRFSLRIPIWCRPRRTPSMQQTQLTNGRSRRPPNSMLVTPSQNYYPTRENNTPPT